MIATTTTNSAAALVQSLNSLLADYFALYLKTKNFHWHVTGPQFRDLHLLFEEQAAELLALTDVIAERVRKNQGATLTSIGSIARATHIADQDDAGLDATVMVRELRTDNSDLIAALRAVKSAASAAGDNATEGMIDDWTDQAERRVWFLSAVAG
jgi:starvation-inducible DNA-binding protein